MQTIDFTQGKGYNVVKFPDGELHLTLDEINRKESVHIDCRICNADDLFLLMQLSDILKRQCVEVYIINIYYLMGMRCDRLFDLGRPFTLGIVADVINSFNARVVNIYEPHSERTLKEIKNSVWRRISEHHDAVRSGDFLLVAPDKGASERYYRKDFAVTCSKKRDAATGKLLDFEVDEHGGVEGKDLLVIDDLCDGGGTFVGLAPKLRDLNPKSLSLLVTHAVQKKGIENVAAAYDKVYITDTYKDWTAEELPTNVEVKTLTK